VFAVLALIAFMLALVLKLYGVTPGIDLVILGFCFVAAHLIYEWKPWRKAGT
jgi:hypothetical protein